MIYDLELSSFLLARLFSKYDVHPVSVKMYTVSTKGIVNLPIGILVIAIILNNITCINTTIPNVFPSTLRLPSL